MWFLQHNREAHKRVYCRSFMDALREFYRQIPDEDGSRPWTIQHRDVNR